MHNSASITIDQETGSPRRRSPHPVEAHDLTVTFGSGRQQKKAVDGLSLSIPAGTIFCLLGPNGAGKTTTINLLMGLLRPTSGAVRVFGRDPAADRREVLSRVALVPQETALYEKLTGRENLTFHGRYYGVPAHFLEPRTDMALGTIGLKSRQHDRVETYSGGMRRRLAMGRALITNAELILLDEPTLGVDVHSRNAIWERIQELADAGRSILLTTNYMEEAEALADYVQLIDRGKTVIGGSPSELKSLVGTEELQLRFGTPEAAERAFAQLRKTTDGGATHSGDAIVALALGGPKQAINTLKVLPNMLGASIDELESFELRRPSLQDVFLHYTGNELRD